MSGKARALGALAPGALIICRMAVGRARIRRLEILCWQHLADEYRAVGKTAEAERAAARARSLPAAPSKTGGKKKL